MLLVRLEIGLLLVIFKVQSFTLYIIYVEKKIMKAYAVKSPTNDGKVFLLCLFRASQVWVRDLDWLG